MSVWGVDSPNCPPSPLYTICSSVKTPSKTRLATSLHVACAAAFTSAFSPSTPPLHPPSLPCTGLHPGFHNNKQGRGGEGLFTPCTVKSSQGPVKSFMISLLNLSRNHFRFYTKEKMNVKVIMQFEIPKRHRFKTYIMYWYGPTGFGGGRGKRGALVEKDKGPMAKKFCYNKSLMETLLRRRRQKNGTNMILFFFNCPFLDMY